jgi:predicted nucleotidyltransferase
MPINRPSIAPDVYLPPPLPPRPRGKRCPPSVREIARRLAPLCRELGITRLEIFGSVARGEATKGSDVDLIATFRKIPGLGFFSMGEDMARRLGVPVDLLLAVDVDEMDNPYRKATIQRDRRVIYRARTS